MQLILRGAVALLGIATFAILLSFVATSDWTSPTGRIQGDVAIPDSSDLPTVPPPPPPPPPPPQAKTDTPAKTNTDTQKIPTAPKSDTPAAAPQTNTDTQAKSDPVSFAKVNSNTRSALVNIYCSTKTGGIIKPFSGSGIIVDPRGIIITNAHLGQYLLLKDYPVQGSIDCKVRLGSPAREMYHAELIYVPKKWIDDHAEDIIAKNPTGTGENDYAFLYITRTINPELTLPASFPYLSIDSNDDSLDEGNQVLIAGYPAEFLGTIATLRDLYITSSVSTIHKLYTFSSNLPDLIGITDTILAQKGASGGAVVNGDSKLIGIVVTATDETSTGARSVNAATMAHVNRSVLAHTGISLQEFIARDPIATGSSFRSNEAPILAKKLIDVIEKQF